MKKLEVKCFFGVNRDNHENNSVFEVIDTKSRKKILSVEFTAKEFTQLMGRMGDVRGKATLLDDHNYTHVGKTPIRDYLLIAVEDNYKTREAEAMAIAERVVKQFDDDNEWEISPYLSSKDSFIRKDGQLYANVKITRYE